MKNKIICIAIVSMLLLLCTASTNAFGLKVENNNIDETDDTKTDSILTGTNDILRVNIGFAYLAYNFGMHTQIITEDNYNTYVGEGKTVIFYLNYYYEARGGDDIVFRFELDDEHSDKIKINGGTGTGTLEVSKFMNPGETFSFDIYARYTWHRWPFPEIWYEKSGTSRGSTTDTHPGHIKANAGFIVIRDEYSDPHIMIDINDNFNMNVGVGSTVQITFDFIIFLTYNDDDGFVEIKFSDGSDSVYAYSEEYCYGRLTITKDMMPDETFVVKIFGQSFDDGYLMSEVNLESHGSTYGEQPPPKIPDLECSGNLIWNNVEPGSSVTGIIILSNVGEEGSELDWAVQDYPTWGIWVISPSSGRDLKPEQGAITLVVQVTVPNEKKLELEGKIKIVNNEDISDYKDISITLSTPKTRSIQLPNWFNLNNNDGGSNLECSGNLIWKNVVPGSSVTGVIVVRNVGKSGSVLNWAVMDYPTWGIWTFGPLSGKGLTPEDGEVTIVVQVIVPNEEKQSFGGKIKIVNTDNIGDYEDIQISLSTPKNKLFEEKPILQLLRNHPLLYRIISEFLSL